jgi:AcrR family transcriptional regulator
MPEVGMMEETKPPRREREKGRQRREMLDAALSLFSDRGYHNVTMHEIADKAEFAIGTLYKYFKNKEDLYRALLLDTADEFRAEIRKALEGQKDEIDKFRSFVRTKAQLFRLHLPLIRLYFSETYGESFNLKSGLDTEIRRRRDESLKALAAIFESGMKKKRFKRIADPYSMAIALDAITTAFLFQWIEAPESRPLPEDPDAILDILFKGLVDL